MSEYAMTQSPKIHKLLQAGVWHTPLSWLPMATIGGKSPFNSQNYLWFQFVVPIIVLLDIGDPVFFSNSVSTHCFGSSMFSIVLGPHAHISYLSMLFVLSLFVHICKKIKPEMDLNCNQNIKLSLQLIHTSLTATHSTMRTILVGKAYMTRMFTCLALERASLTSLWIEAYRWLSWSGCNLIGTLPGRSGTLPIPVKQSEDRSQINIPLSLVLTAKKSCANIGRRNLTEQACLRAGRRAGLNWRV